MLAKVVVLVVAVLLLIPRKEMVEQVQQIKVMLAEMQSVVQAHIELVAVAAQVRLVNHLLRAVLLEMVVTV
jgi:hypothetical protein